jgi:hypothetical protein
LGRCTAGSHARKRYHLLRLASHARQRYHLLRLAAKKSSPNHKPRAPTRGKAAPTPAHPRGAAYTRPPARGRQLRRPPGEKIRTSVCFRIVGSRTANPCALCAAISFSGRRSGAKTSTARLEGYIISQHGNTIRLALDRQKSEVGEAALRHTHSKKAGDRGPKRRKPGHSPPAGGVSMGPSALDRKPSAVHSSVRSHGIVGSQRGAPRRQHCRPPACCEGFWHALRGQVGRIPSPGVAGERTWPVREAPDRNIRARQRPRDGTLRGDSALRPRTAAF